MYVPRDATRPPGNWGIPSRIISQQERVSPGPHEWGAEKGGVARCRNCGVGVFVGTEGRERAFVRLAGTLCSDLLAMQVMGA